MNLGEIGRVNQSEKVRQLYKPYVSARDWDVTKDEQRSDNRSELRPGPRAQVPRPKQEASVHDDQGNL